MIEAVHAAEITKNGEVHRVVANVVTGKAVAIVAAGKAVGKAVAITNGAEVASEVPLT